MIEHALRLADQDGRDAVTIRRLAADFSVTPMALYWHVNNKDELLAAMGDALFDGVEVPAELSGDWTQQLRFLLDQLLAALRAHPASADLAFERILQCERGRRLTERSLGVLRDAGFDVRCSSDLARQALLTAVTLVERRPGAERSVPAAHRTEMTQRKRAALAGLPVERFPNLVACAGSLTECPDVPGYYRNGMDVYLAGVQALAPTGVVVG